MSGFRIFVSALLCLVFSSARADRLRAPHFFVAGDVPDADPLPLKSTRADVRVAGAVADVLVTQVYRNQGKRTLEGAYVFPMSTRAAVHGMRMTIGARVIEAQLRERDDARRIYEDAKDAGRTASLLDQERPNVFQMRVANILPGDEVRVELRYVERLTREGPYYELVFPNTVGPRYTSRSEVESGTEVEFVATPYLHARSLAAHTFALDATISSGIPITAVDCPSHGPRAHISHPAPREARVHLAESDDVADRDFILRYSLAGKEFDAGLLFEPTGPSGQDGYFALLVEPPARHETQAIVPREYLFVLDVSGSMDGFPLAVSKTLMRRLLTGLRSTDRFDILTFAGGSELFSPVPLDATPENLRRAEEFLRAQHSGGGTELLAALKRTLALPPSGDAARVIVVLTDGFITVEAEAFELIRRSLDKASLFAFGIGTSVNRFLIEGMARAGQGEPFVATDQEEAVRQADRFRTYVQAPLLTAPRVRFEEFDAYDVEPPVLPDLFAERPLLIYGRYHGPPRGRIVVEGQSASGRFLQTIEVAQSQRAPEGDALRLLWARARIERLVDLEGAGGEHPHQKEITALGLAHSLSTPYTSFVAADSVRRGDGKNVSVRQPLPLPAKVEDSALCERTATRIGEASGSSGGGLLGTGGGGFGRLSGGLLSHRAGAPELIIAAAEVHGALDKNIIRRVIRSHLNEIRFIYEQALLRQPSLTGRVVIELVIGGDGKVSTAVVQSSTLGLPLVEEKIAMAVRRWEFPRVPGGGHVVVRYPFQLTPN